MKRTARWNVPILAAMAAATSVLLFRPPAAADPPPDLLIEKLYHQGGEIAAVIAPGRPPAHKQPPVVVPQADPVRGTNVLASVPALDWCYGCSATSAAMLFGYYDNAADHANMYAGPTNDGVFPMTNAAWGYGECPLSATHMGVDGRTIRGHVDDYYWGYNVFWPEPFLFFGWPEHVQGDCTGDFMGTNQYLWNMPDAATTFWFWTDGSPMIDFTDCEYWYYRYRDGTRGMKLFANSRGYEVVTNYNQLIRNDPWYNSPKGFTFDQYCGQIDNGRPVMIQVEGHSMLGFGYNREGKVIYLHDTWDHQDHQMAWGGDYYGMRQWGVAVVKLAPIAPRSVAILSPDGSEGYVGGDTIPIRWKTLGPDWQAGDQVKLEYSADRGATWSAIAGAEALAYDQGTFDWATSQDLPGGRDYRVRVSYLGDPAVSDTSDASFTLVTIQITMDGGVFDAHEGTATLRVRVVTMEPTSVQCGVRAQQPVGRFIINGCNNGALQGEVDGEVLWRTVVVPWDGRFAGGKADVCVYAPCYDPALGRTIYIQASAVVQLQGPGTDRDETAAGRPKGR